MSGRRLKILIWHIHGGYLNALVRADHEWYVPIKPDRSPGYIGRGHTFDLPEYVREVAADEVKDLDLDLLIFQTPQNLQEDQYRILSRRQQALPKIYIEHNTPRPHPTDSRHVVDDPSILLVHVTDYNRLMWDNGGTPTTVIEHSVAIDPAVRYSGDLARGITVINGMRRRPRISGYDIYERARARFPLDAAGMETEEIGGIGDIPYRDLHRRIAAYRFLFSPMRYTSLPLAVIEALTMGMPVIALATTELPTVIQNGVTGYLSCREEELIERAQELLADPIEARRLGDNARELALSRFSLERFVRDWNGAFERAMSLAPSLESVG